MKKTATLYEWSRLSSETMRCVDSLAAVADVLGKFIVVCEAFIDKENGTGRVIRLPAAEQFRSAAREVLQDLKTRSDWALEELARSKDEVREFLGEDLNALLEDAKAQAMQEGYEEGYEAGRDERDDEEWEARIGKEAYSKALEDVFLDIRDWVCGKCFILPASRQACNECTACPVMEVVDAVKELDRANGNKRLFDL